MKLMVNSWNSTGRTYNAEAEETRFLHYSITQEFNRPARATIILGDPDGSIMQKYDIGTDDVYVGSGVVTIEDPTGTDVFYGRILKARHDTATHRVYLLCEDLMSQLDIDSIDYDMREELNTSHLRQSTVHTDPDSAVYVGPAYPYAPLAGFVMKDSDEEIDDTADANDAGANDVGLLAKIGEAIAVGNSANFGLTNRCDGIRLNVGLAGTGGYVLTWYYSQGADAWGALSVTDGTNSFKTAGTNNITFTPPSDWATDEVGGITCLWVRAEITSGSAPWTEAHGTQAWGIEKRVWDDDMAWAADTYNSMYMILPNDMAGSITVRTGPYDESVYYMENAPLVTDSPAAGATKLWASSGVDADTHEMEENGGHEWAVKYYFRMLFTLSDFYVASSITDMRVTMVYKLDSTTHVTYSNIYIWDSDGLTAYMIGRIDADASTNYKTVIFTVPSYLFGEVIDANGAVVVSITNFNNDTTTTLNLDKITIEADISTTGYSSSIEIYDTESNFLVTDTDLTAAATCIWEGCPYSIVRPINLHINGLITGHNPLIALTTSVESTTGLSSRHYTERTTLEILQDLASMDASVFWLPLATTQVTWKSTFNNGAPTAITDANVLYWKDGEYDFEPVVNEWHVYGMRIGTSQVYGETTDATSVAKYGLTRSRSVSNTGVMSDHDAKAQATAMVTRDKDTQLFLNCTIGGLSALRLGDEVSITSTLLGLTAANYVITGWAYDSGMYRTSLRLHPRVSQAGFTDHKIFSEYMRSLAEGTARANRDIYAPPLYTQTWS